MTTATRRTFLVGASATAATLVSGRVWATPRKAGTARAGAPLRFGMSSPSADWSKCLSDVQAKSGKLQARRLFVSGFSSVPGFLRTAKSEWAAGRYPVLSLSTTEWTKFASGAYDPQIRTWISQIKANNHPMSWALKHEPIGDGDPKAYAAMQAHVAPMFKQAGLSFGPIFNGFAWSSQGQGMTEAEIAQWIPDSVIPQFDFVASDCYHGGTTAKPGEDAGPKMRGMSAWATRKGVTKLGIGEFSGLTAPALGNAYSALHADGRYAWACVFNSSRNNRPGVDWTLTGDRLTSFQQQLA